MQQTHASSEFRPARDDSKGGYGDGWLGIVPSSRVVAAFEPALPALVNLPSVRSTLSARGVRTGLFDSAVRSDLYRLAHALTVLVDHGPKTVLASILPEHLYSVISGLDYRLGHVGREVLCPVEPLLEAWHRACDALGFARAPQTGPTATERGDLVFPSVQVVEAIRRENPDVEAVTIASSFIYPARHCKPVYIELFFAGHRDGSRAQSARHMDTRLASLRLDPFRTVAPQPPICHLSIQVRDRSLLEEVHQFGQTDRSGLVTPYAAEISVNPGDNSHNTKLAVQKTNHPSAPVNVLEFVYFAS